ncbi:tigger transposable element-derived protein 1 [Trichonephila clavipes]|uniref:Tigger transposable element-derived protein 1 n=1 Tax=Trichonephila clavipes TaxID=2585209 RepID=A0A8X7BKC1_TRICX|nr:tigger transposable element-derived protein 1 [Trichonephila clavipes]
MNGDYFKDTGTRETTPELRVKGSIENVSEVDNGVSGYTSWMKHPEFYSCRSGYSDGVQKLLDSHNQELTIDELIEMYQQDLDIKESLDPVQSEDRMTVGNLADDLSLFEKGLKILENIGSNVEFMFPTKQGIKNY